MEVRLMENITHTLLEELVELLSLEPLEDNIFRGQSQDLGFGRVYGGQVIGQALAAARQTVREDRYVHSLHSYFLKEGDTRMPIIYNVECISNGRSFDTRQVSAIQKGRLIFTLTASFHKKEDGFDHQDKMPITDSPEVLIDEDERCLKFPDVMPEHIRKESLCKSPIEIRQVEPKNPYLPEIRAPINKIWFRSAGKLLDNQDIHTYLLAYASDFQLLSTTLFPHEASVVQSNMQVASLDHAMWFHRDFRMDDWLLYAVDSPSASGARGLVRGQIFNQQGFLVASIMQEGLIRKN